MSLLSLMSAIKEHYEMLDPIILEASKKRISAWVGPYSHYLEWESVMSPIEKGTWQVLRAFGHTPMYPQYPVGKYFLDFGNPVVKVAIECDGKEFHKDKEKDKRRDKYLNDKGWDVFRITGSDCMRDTFIDHRASYDYGYYDLRDMHDFYFKTIDGLIKAIGIWYFDYQTYDEKRNESQFSKEILLKRISFESKRLKEKVLQ